ncbi:hypothetical protein ACFLZ7_02430 [Nanoarchaeota archaeon]
MIEMETAEGRVLVFETDQSKVKRKLKEIVGDNKRYMRFSTWPKNHYSEIARSTKREEEKEFKDYFMNQN